VPKGRPHDPLSYESDTWDQAKAAFSPAPVFETHAKKRKGA
jgi:hypothetical protein